MVLYRKFWHFQNNTSNLQKKTNFLKHFWECGTVRYKSNCRHSKHLSLSPVYTKELYFKGYDLEGESYQGAVSIRKTVLPGMAIPMLKIRRPNGRLIFNMEIAIRR